jgi:excisionase family DNA binding protein
MTSSLPTLLTQGEAAERLRISTRSIRRLIATGQLRPIRIGSRTLITERELANYLAAAYRQQAHTQ